MLFRKANRKRTPLKERARNAGAAIGAAVKRLVPLVAIAAVAVAIPFGAFSAYLHIISTPYFAVDDIRVEGTTLLDEAEVLQHGGITEGMNAFDVDVERVKARLESRPWIKSVRVEKRLPETLLLEIEERKASAILVDGAAYVLLDESGEPFKTLEPTDAVDELLQLPLITGLSRDEIDGEPGRALVAEALEVVRLAERYELPDLSEVHIDPTMGLSVVPAKDGVEIRLGRGRYEERLERLRAVFAAIEDDGRDVDYIIIDQEGKLNRVTVGGRAMDGMADDGSPN